MYEPPMYEQGIILTLIIISTSTLIWWSTNAYLTCKWFLEGKIELWKDEAWEKRGIYHKLGENEGFWRMKLDDSRSNGMMSQTGFAFVFFALGIIYSTLWLITVPMTLFYVWLYWKKSSLDKKRKTAEEKIEELEKELRQLKGEATTPNNPTGET